MNPGALSLSVIESLALAEKRYSLASLPLRCGAPQSAAVSESASATLGVTSLTAHPVTRNSTGTTTGATVGPATVKTSVSR